MSAPLVRVHVHQSTGTIILNRPEKRNALSRALLAELAQALGDLHQERRVRAVVLTGSGGAFCAGMDMEEIWSTSQTPQAASQWQDDLMAYQDLLQQMLEFPKPLIAAVGGPALAAGAGLTLACDLVIADAHARFGLPEPRWGLVSGVVAPLLVFRLGAGYASYLLLSSRTIDAAEAHRVRLFHELVQSDLLWVRATELAAECAAGAPQSLQMTKRLLNETIGEWLAAAMAAGAATGATARTTEAAQEGLSAFHEKRPSQWP